MEGQLNIFIQHQKFTNQQNYKEFYKENLKEAERLREQRKHPIVLNSISMRTGETISIGKLINNFKSRQDGRDKKRNELLD